MKIKSSGSQNISCTKKDIRNFEQRLRDKHRDIHVESSLVEFFSMKQKGS